MFLLINFNVLWILFIILFFICGMFGLFNLNCKFWNEKKKKYLDFYLFSKGWLGEGEMKRRRLMGKRYILGGENVLGGFYWFLFLKCMWYIFVYFYFIILK